MENKNLMLLIAIAIIFLILGGSLGIFYQQIKTAADLKNDSRILAIKELASSVVPSITAYGQVESIDGRDITLNFNGETMKIKIKDDAFVFIPAMSANANGTASAQKTAEFKDIKVGDNVNVNLKVAEDGQIEGQMVIILQK